MCGGIPFIIASVAKILRKSCGVKSQGLACGIGEPVPAEGAGDQPRIAGGADGPVFHADAVLEQHGHGRVPTRARGRRRRRPAGRPRGGRGCGADDRRPGRRRVRGGSPAAVPRRSWTGRCAAAGRARRCPAAGTGPGCDGKARSAPRPGCRCAAAPRPPPRPRTRYLPPGSGPGGCRCRGPRPRSAGRGRCGSRAAHRLPGRGELLAGPAARAAASRPAAWLRACSTAAASAGSTGSRSRVRWSIRDLRRLRLLGRAMSSRADRAAGRPPRPTGPGPRLPTGRCRGRTRGRRAGR